MAVKSIADAFSLGLKVESIATLRSFTESDPHLSFHQIDIHFEYIAESLKWQATNILSEDFLSKELCCFLDRQGSTTIYFSRDSNNSGTPRFWYALCDLKNPSGIFEQAELFLSGPQNILETTLKEQLESYGFILWKADKKQQLLETYNLKYGTFRNFYPNVNLSLLINEELLRCEHNTRKAIKYLKLLHKSYLERLSKVFDALPNVLLDIIVYYVLGEFLIETLYWG
ncbi:MAG: hypothetical protein Hyperionvirus16_48 [Hyperionvirus sp.]|uniref:Uncharacterized protein n=1 Tax=Hyperionvirus sp. TaxID=2487770 RepID=A0A3G5ADW2_9VIRU|nr:MAG: hypothetical protein Hyperionvirus16_48 [Hyperionvirus sp.]